MGLVPARRISAAVAFVERVRQAAAREAVSRVLQEQPVIVRGEFLHGELVGFLAADGADDYKVIGAAVIADHNRPRKSGWRKKPGDVVNCRPLQS